MKKIAPDSVPDEARRMKLELPKPEGYVYYASDLTVSGTSIRRKECKKFLLLKGVKHFSLIREPKNKYDRNAIAFYCDNLMLGYVDKDTAAQIAADGIFDELIVYPKTLYVTRTGWLMIDYALLKPGVRFQPDQQIPFIEFGEAAPALLQTGTSVIRRTGSFVFAILAAFAWLGIASTLFSLLTGEKKENIVAIVPVLLIAILFTWLSKKIKH